MEAVPLICPKCGADLDVPDGVEIFRCQYCGSKCRVKSSGSVRGLALLEATITKVAQHTERTANGIDQLVAANSAARRAKQQAREQWKRRMAELNRASDNVMRWGIFWICFTLCVPPLCFVAAVASNSDVWIRLCGVMALGSGCVGVLAVVIFSIKRQKLVEEVKIWRSREPL
jgi:DNA-directed RNA polymerase subunit RPC12/RpoP/uncharacterized protein YjeT (DUF2065 family)